MWGLSAVGMWGGNLPLRAQATLQMCDSAAVGRRTDFTAGDTERAIGVSLRSSRRLRVCAPPRCERIVLMFDDVHGAAGGEG